MGIVNAIVSFFRALFAGGGGSAKGGGLGGGQQAPTDETSMAYFFWKVANNTNTYTSFAGAPQATVQNDPDLSPTNKQTLIQALNTGGWTGFQSVYNELVSESNAQNAVVWICIWIVAPRKP